MRLVIIPDAMEAAMKRDLDRLRDSLPEDERAAYIDSVWKFPQVEDFQWCGEHKDRDDG